MANTVEASEEIAGVEDEHAQTTTDEGETPEAEVSEETPDDSDDEEADDVVITIGDAPPPTEEPERFEGPAPQWVKELRKRDKEQARRIRELEAQVKTQQPAPAVTVRKPPTEPAFDSEEIDYDRDKYKAALLKYADDKRLYEEEQNKSKAALEQQAKALTARFAKYQEDAKALGASDFQDAESVVSHTLTPIQQGYLFRVTDRPEVVVLALGRNPQEAKRLAAITDPAEFAAAAVKLEAKVKMSTRKPTTKPESTTRGNANSSGVVDGTLKRLREEADKTGDRTPVINYMRKQREAAERGKGK